MTYNPQEPPQPWGQPQGTDLSAPDQGSPYGNPSSPYVSSSYPAPQPPVPGFGQSMPPAAYSQPQYGAFSAPQPQEPDNNYMSYASSTLSPYGTSLIEPGQRSSACTAWWLGLFLGFIAPLIFWGDTNPFVRKHVREAMNLHLTWGIVLVVTVVLAFLTYGIALAVLGWAAGYPLITCIVGAVKASNGHEFSAPAIKFFR